MCVCLVSPALRRILFKQARAPPLGQDVVDGADGVDVDADADCEAGADCGAGGADFGAGGGVWIDGENGK